MYMYCIPLAYSHDTVPLVVSRFAKSHKPIIRGGKSSSLGGTMVDPDYRPEPAFIDPDLDLDPDMK